MNAEPRTPLFIQPRSKQWDSVFQGISWWKTEVIKQAKVMVVGAGALGNEVLKNLTLMNVGNILIVDFDHIEYSNLSRSILFRESDCETRSYKAEIAARRIREINSNVKVKTIIGDITIDVGLGIFRRMDVVIGCLDNRLARLFLNRACYKVNRIWIDGAIENLTGQVAVYKPFSSCYECSLRKMDWFNIQYRLGCHDVAKRNYSQGRIPTTPISASIVAAVQVQEALKVIHKDEKNLMNGELYYEGMSNMIEQFKPKPLKDFCLSHYEYEPILESPLSAENTVGEALSWLSKEFADERPVLLLDNDLALGIATKESERSYELVKPSLHLTDKFLDSYRVVKGEDVYIKNEVKEIDASFPHQHLRLADIGIPPLHIVRVMAQQQIHHVELSADEAFLSFE